MNRLTAIALFWVVLSQAGIAGAQEPMEALKDPVDRTLSVLKDPQYREPGQKTAQRERLWQLVLTLFDFDAVSQRTLGRNWRIFSPEEKARFTAIFTRLIGNTYIDRIQGEFADEEVVFLDQELVRTNQALVKTHLVRGNMTIPIDYWMHRQNGTWKVYDVLVEGISLVKNYRTQFNKLLLKITPAQLIDRLQKKVDDQDSKREAAAPTAVRGYTATWLAGCRLLALRPSLLGSMPYPLADTFQQD